MAWINGSGRESKEVWKVELQKQARSAANGIFRSLWCNTLRGEFTMTRRILD